MSCFYYKVAKFRSLFYSWERFAKIHFSFGGITVLQSLKPSGLIERWWGHSDRGGGNIILAEAFRIIWIIQQEGGLLIVLVCIPLIILWTNIYRDWQTIRWAIVLVIDSAFVDLKLVWPVLGEIRYSRMWTGWCVYVWYIMGTVCLWNTQRGTGEETGHSHCSQQTCRYMSMFPRASQECCRFAFSPGRILSHGFLDSSFTCMF